MNMLITYELTQTVGTIWMGDELMEYSVIPSDTAVENSHQEEAHSQKVELVPLINPTKLELNDFYGE